MTEAAPTGSIVVGHDGSDGSDAALDEALSLALEIGAPVVVVRAWSIVTAPRPTNWELGYTSLLEDYAVAVRKALDDDVRSRLQAFPGVSVACRAEHEVPAKCLVDASREARMLVVGARGMGGLAQMLLGSVSEQCTRHAKCPVLVVKRPRG